MINLFLHRGAVPYGAISYFDLLEFLESGGRLSKPDFCPDCVYNLLQRCWAAEPSVRPDFSEIVNEIEDLTAKSKSLNIIQFNRTVHTNYYNESEKTEN